jgi:translation elongation factor EF-Tu-like GTPase
MKKRSTYQINDTFRITGRGIVFVGNISEGLVSIGNWIEFDFNGTKIKRKITGIEGIRSIKEENNCGLLIETLDDKEVDELKKWQPNGQTALIFESIK